MTKLYPLTREQEGLWIEWKYDPYGTSYNTCVKIKLEGQLDVAKFCQAAQDVVSHFELLRSYFVEEAGKVFLALSDEKYHLEYLDLTNQDIVDPSKKALEFLEEKRNKAIDLRAFPLISAALIKAGEQEFYFIGMVPHIISDGISALYFLQSISQIYNKGFAAFKEEQGDAKNWLTYLVEREAESSAEKQQADEQYWQENLAEAEHVLDIGKKLCERTSFLAKREKFEISPESSKFFRKLAFSNRTSIFSVIAALFASFAKRYFNPEQLLVGYPVNIRPVGYKNAFGFFVNVIPLNIDLSGDPTFIELVARIDARRRSDKKHQNLSSLDIVKAKRQTAKDFSGQMFNVSMVETVSRLQNLTLDGIISTSLDTEVIEIHDDLSFIYEISETHISFWFEYLLDNFSEQQVKQMTEHMQNLLQAIEDNPEQKISSYNLVNKSEENLLVKEWNETESPYQHKTLPEFIEAAAAKYPTALALQFGSNQITYQELNERANYLAHFLLSKQLEPAAKIALILPRSIEQITVMLAIVKAGATYLPIDITAPAERVAEILADAQVRFLFTSHTYQSKFVELKQDKLYIEQLTEYSAGQAATNPELANLDDLAYLIYTSGSTGKPKGVMLTHRALAVRLSWLQEDFPVSTADKILQNTNYSFDISVAEIWWPLSMGASLILADSEKSKSAAYLISLIKQQQITTSCLVPSAFNLILKALHDPQDLASLKQILLCGEALSLNLVQDYFKFGQARLFNLYGPTEATIYASSKECSAQDKMVTIGKAITNTEFYVLNEQLNLQPIGTIGELYIGGAALAEGYLNRAALTAERFIENPYGQGKIYRTGDLVRYLANGEIEYISRADNQIKLRGYRIELDEIAAVLREFPELDESLVLIKNINSSKQIVAYYAAAQEIAEIKLREFLAEKLPEYMVPNFIIYLQELPKLASGKLNRKTLPEPQITHQQKIIPVKTKQQKAVQEIFAKLLRIDKKLIGLENSFFELGGDSLMTLELSALLERKKIYIEPHELFAQRTINAILAHAKDYKISYDNNELITGTYPLHPRQDKFFAEAYQNPHHWLRAALVEFDSKKLELNKLIAALNQVINFHDSLRLSFREISGKWQLDNHPANLALKVAEYDLTDIAAEQLTQVQNNYLNQAARTVSLEQAPLIKAVYFKLADNKARFALLIHHLTIDMHSLNIILRDVVDCYKELVKGRNPQNILRKTTDLRTYQSWLAAYKAEQQELDFWQEQLAAGSAIGQRLASLKLEESAQDYIELTLTKEQSIELREVIAKKHDSELQHILLAGFANALRDYFATDSFTVNICSHARGKLAEDINLSRTVGWLNSVFPIALKPTEPDFIKQLGQHITEVPLYGLGYMVERYKQQNPALLKFAEPKFFFNYVSRVESELPDNFPLKLLEFNKDAQLIDPQNKAAYLLNIEAATVDGQVIIRISYCQKFFKPEQITQFKQRYLAHLVNINEQHIAQSA